MTKPISRRTDRRTPWEADTRGSSEHRLTPETKQAIIVVLLFSLSFILLLSLFDLAGPVGRGLDRGMRLLFGWARYLLPFIGAIIGFSLLRPDRLQIRRSGYIGLALFVVSFAGLLHLVVPAADMQSAVDSGRGGGGVGFVIRSPLHNLFGSWATVIVLAALFIIALLIMFNTTLHRLADHRSLLDRLGNRFKLNFYRAKIAIESRHEREPETGPVAFEKRTFSTGGEAAAPATENKTGTSEAAQLAMFPKVKRLHRNMDLPIELLEAVNEKPMSGNVEANKQKIQKTLETFGITVEMAEINVGPTVTQYTLKPAEGVKLAQITTLQNDLSLALAAHPIRIEAPIPGKSLVGIEVPNKAAAVVGVREIIDSQNFKNRKSSLTFALGKDVAGGACVADLDPMPHLLIAGATGSGKSVCINAIIMSLLYSNSPDDLKFIFVDPKRVELTVYNDIPHLLTPVITDVDKTISALKWVVGEMERRFELLSTTGKRNIQMYHREVDDGMPYIVVVIDELADLMAVAANDVEGAIIRLAQMARAVGIHLVVATQRPSVDVITGLIKANITARIAFNVASLVDSRTILDMSGAEKLLGKGDMLFLSSDLSKPKRIQGAYVSDRDIERVVAHLRNKAKPEYDVAIVEKPSAQTLDELELAGDDDLLNEAKETILRSGKASASLLQRRLRIGYARAARILDLLEEQGFIGPGDGAKPREILVRRDQPISAYDDESDTEEAEEEPVEEAVEEEPDERT